MTATTTRVALSLPHHFAELRKNIEPPKHRKEAAATIPDQVRAFLEDSTDFPTAAPHSLLSGSYARHTAIHAIKDVDFVVFAAPVDEDPDPEEVLEDLYAALRDLPDALDRTGRVLAMRRQRRSIHVAFDHDDFHLDVVPALLPDGTGKTLLVPDNEWGTWEESDPLGYGDALSALNRETGDKAVPLVKLFKHWRTVQMQRRRPKSYYLEALTYRHLNEGWVTTVGKSDAEMFTDLLRSVRDDFQAALHVGEVPEIPDPMLGHDVAFNWEWDAFKSFMTRLDESIGWAEHALAKTKDEFDEAVELWQKVFGTEYFEDSLTARRLQQADWLRSGPIFVTGAGRVLSERPAGERAVASPRHRFYGDAD